MRNLKEGERKGTSTEAVHHSSVGLTQLVEEKRPEVTRLMRIVLSWGYLPISSTNLTMNEVWFTFSITPRPSPLRQRTRTESPLWSDFSNSNWFNVFPTGCTIRSFLPKKCIGHNTLPYIQLMKLRSFHWNSCLTTTNNRVVRASSRPSTFSFLSRAEWWDYRFGLVVYPI